MLDDPCHLLPSPSNTWKGRCFLGNQIRKPWDCSTFFCNVQNFQTCCISHGPPKTAGIWRSFLERMNIYQTFMFGAQNVSFLGVWDMLGGVSSTPRCWISLPFRKSLSIIWNSVSWPVFFWNLRVFKKTLPDTCCNEGWFIVPHFFRSFPTKKNSVSHHR